MLKLIATCFMLIDHMGMVFFQEVVGFRMIGRLAMPLFAYSLARGFSKTKALGDYKKRLAIFALLSQIPYGVMNYAAYRTPESLFRLNIGFTFLAALWVLSFYRDLKECLFRKKEAKLYKLIQIGGLGISSIALLVLATVLQCDYGAYGILLVLTFYEGYICQKNPYLTSYLILGITLLMGVSMGSSWMVMQVGGGLLGFLFVLFVKDSYLPRLKYFFYVIYPLHMLLFGLVKWIGVKN